MHHHYHASLLKKQCRNRDGYSDRNGVIISQHAPSGSAPIKTGQVGRSGPEYRQERQVQVGSALQDRRLAPRLCAVAERAQALVDRQAERGRQAERNEGWGGVRAGERNGAGVGQCGSAGGGVEGGRTAAAASRRRSAT